MSPYHLEDMLRHSNISAENCMQARRFIGDEFMIEGSACSPDRNGMPSIFNRITSQLLL